MTFLLKKYPKPYVGVNILINEAPLRAVGYFSVPRSVARTAGEYPIIAPDPTLITITTNIITIMTFHHQVHHHYTHHHHQNI